LDWDEWVEEVIGHGGIKGGHPGWKKIILEYAAFFNNINGYYLFDGGYYRLTTA